MPSPFHHAQAPPCAHETLPARPALAPVLLPFAAAIAVSRVVLGVHYPSDVLAAAAIGAALACSSFHWMPAA